MAARVQRGLDSQRPVQGLRCRLQSRVLAHHQAAVPPHRGCVPTLIAVFRANDLGDFPLRHLVEPALIPSETQYWAPSRDSGPWDRVSSYWDGKLAISNSISCCAGHDSNTEIRVSPSNLGSQG